MANAPSAATGAMIWNLPVHRASEMETGWDALGGVMVVGLLAGMVGVMRHLLTG